MFFTFTFRLTAIKLIMTHMEATISQSQKVLTCHVIEQTGKKSVHFLLCVHFRRQVESRREAMARNRYNRIPLHILSRHLTGKEHKQLRSHKVKQAESQKDITSQTDGQQAVLNKTNKKSKTNRKRTSNVN